MRSFAAVLFDLDNTLYDRDASFRGWAAWFARQRLGLPDQLAHQAAIEELVARDSHGDCPRPEFFGWLKQRHPALTATTEALMTDYYRDHLVHLARDEATDRLLDALAAARVPFGIITNGSANQLHKIERLGLTDRAACVFVSALFGCRKPEAAIFLAAAATLGHATTEILFVGDNPEADIIGAAGVGMRTAWLHRGRPWPGRLPLAPDHIIDSLEQLAEVIRC